MPQARFWMAMAMPQLSRVRPRSPVIGRVNRPKLVRTPLPMAAMMQPAMISTSSGTAGRRADEFGMERFPVRTPVYARSRITESDIAEWDASNPVIICTPRKQQRRAQGPARNARSWRRSGGLLDRNARFFQVRLQFASLEHLAHDIGAADKFALHIELGNGRPVGIGLDPIAQFFAFEHVGAAIFNAEIAQDLHDLPGKTALREV